MNVLLVDDHPLVLGALKNIIHTLDPSVVVHTAENPEHAFALLAGGAGIDLVLLDLLLGQAVDGFAVLGQMRQRHPALPVVVVSAVDKLGDMVRVIDMGAMGFVPKTSPTAGLTDAVALVLAGGVYIPPALLRLVQQGVSLAEAAAAADAAISARAALALATQRSEPAATDGAEPAVLKPMGEPAADPAAQAAQAPSLSPSLPGPAASARAGLAGLGLTPRQSDVLLLLLRGLPNKLIARELGLSVDTVKDHVAAVLRALNVATRTQAVLVVSRLNQQQAAALDR